MQAWWNEWPQLNFRTGQASQEKTKDKESLHWNQLKNLPNLNKCSFRVITFTAFTALTFTFKQFSPASPSTSKHTAQSSAGYSVAVNASAVVPGRAFYTRLLSGLGLGSSAGGGAIARNFSLQKMALLDGVAGVGDWKFQSCWRFCDVSSCEPNKLWKLRGISLLWHVSDFSQVVFFAGVVWRYNGTSHMFMPHAVVHLMPSKENALLLASSLNSTLLCKPRRTPLHSSHCLDAKEALTRSALNFRWAGCLWCSWNAW